MTTKIKKQISGKMLCCIIALVMPIMAFGQGQTITVPIGETVTGDLFGNSNNANGIGNADLTPIGNTLIIDGTVNDNMGLEGSAMGATANAAWAGTATGAVTGNTVTVNVGGTVANTVRGGFSYDNSHEASNNTVNVYGTVYSAVFGGSTLGSNANDNTVIVSGTAGGVCGGSTEGGGTASGNTVTINGGSVFNHVTGGSSYTGAAENNTVIIKGNTTIGVFLMGGNTNGTSSGNKLKIYSTNLTVDEVRYFQIMNFHLPADITNNATMIISTDPSDIAGVTVELDFATTAPTLAVGDLITLIENVTGIPDNDGDSFDINDYTFEISVLDGALIATVMAAPIVTFTVTFSGEEIDIEPQTIEEGNLATKPADPERTNYDFGGWYTDNDTFENKWDFETDVVMQDTTLYAKWEQTIGIEQLQVTNYKLQVYPNPANSRLNVKLENNANGTLTLFDMSGKIVLSQAVNGNSAQINVSQLSAGNYILRLLENGTESDGVQVIKK